MAIANYTANLEMWIGVNGELIWINSDVKKFTGYSPEEFMTMADFLAALVLKEDLLEVHEKYSYALNGSEKNGSEIEFRCVRKDSSIFWIDVNWSKVYDTNGKFLGIRVSGRDITSFKLANYKIEKITNQYDIIVLHKTVKM